MIFVSYTNCFNTEQYKNLPIPDTVISWSTKPSMCLKKNEYQIIGGRSDGWISGNFPRHFGPPLGKGMGTASQR